MAEIEITLPTVQYGNAKVRATPEELGVNDISDSYELGVAAAVYLNLFQQGFKHGATLDVSAPQSAEQSEVKEVFAGAVATAQEEAQRLLSEGLGGVTEIEATSVVEASGIAPWDDSDLKVDAKPKPWETDSRPVQSVSELISDEW